MDINKEKKLHAAWYKKDDPIAFSWYEAESPEYVKDYGQSEKAWLAAKSQAIPKGFVLVANNSKTVVSIEKMVEQQVEASGITQDIFRLDGGGILEAMIEAQEQSHG